MTRHRHPFVDRRAAWKRSAFTLLEVVVTLAMLAVIAIPALGLATMAISRNKDQMTIGNATELKNRIDLALKADRDLTSGVFEESFLQSGPFVIFASEDLEYIEHGTLSEENDQFYRISVSEPAGYRYADEDAYRVMTYEFVWPWNGENPDRNQLFFTTVFRKL
ncbi:type II secretion system protein [Pelagicoccus sp. SDUM812003]|uniref:type II secretion system protein n=1 Tax=Pelagicoccus sp. SDUM812003 TaxID=3041267 RepID=UPI00280CC000|nr:type II secretion system protein [Pelagicoccus sp. SDUM812003]MDQ8204569.1 type II secretion system protein [Pelagicoccus sp. SDUM812003]